MNIYRWLKRSLIISTMKSLVIIIRRRIVQKKKNNKKKINSLFIAEEKFTNTFVLLFVLSLSYFKVFVLIIDSY